MRIRTITALRRIACCVTLAAIAALPIHAHAAPTDDEPVQRRGCVALQYGRAAPIGKLTRCTIVTLTSAHSTM
jgi:hypothetical protein